MNEKEKYDQMKYNIRNTKSRDELSENNKKTMKMHRLKKNIFLFCVYKIVKITKETWEKNDVEVIAFNGKKWLNEKHIETRLEHSNLPAITNKCDLMYKKCRFKLQNCGKNQPCRIF